MNILIKLMSIISLVIAPTLANIHQVKIEQNRNLKMETLRLLQSETAHQQGIKSRNVWTLQTRNPANLSIVEKDVKRFIDVLEEDHAITNSTSSVEVADAWLYINGVKVSPEINNRYKKYYERTGDFITAEARR